MINNLVGGKSGEFDLQHDRLIERLGQVLEYAVPRGVTIAIEPHVFTILESPLTTKQIIDEIDSPQLRVQFDISHFDVLGYTLDESVLSSRPLPSIPTSRTNAAGRPTMSFSPQARVRSTMSPTSRRCGRPARGLHHGRGERHGTKETRLRCTRRPIRPIGRCPRL